MKAQRKAEGVRIGTTVTITVESEGRKEARTYTINGGRGDPPKGTISYNSPLGRALLGAVPGEERTVKSPQGKYIVKVVSINEN